MSENDKVKDFNHYIEWLNNSIAEEHIKYYEYLNFKNFQQIGRGSYGNVVRVNWKDSDRFFALKSFNNDEQTIKEVVKEKELENYKLNLNSSNRAIDMNDDLINNTSLNINNEYENGIGLQNHSLDIIEGNSSSNTSNQIFTTPDNKVKELIKDLTETKSLYALKLLFENFQCKFSSQVLINSLKALANPTLFDYYSKENIARLELHLRTLVAVLEQICFSPTVLSKDLQDNVCHSLSKFAEIHQKTTQVTEIVNNNFQRNEDIRCNINKCNYNIDFLLIHLRDTLHSIRDDKTLFQELLRRVKNVYSTILNITPSSRVTVSNVNYSILSQLRQDLNFKYPVAPYYANWRIMLIIQHNIFNWSESDKEIINKRFGEMILIEYFWSYLEEEWINITDKSVLDFQTKFNEVSNKLPKSLNNTGSFLNDLIGYEPFELPNILWFGILDLAQNLIQKSSQTATYGLCYYMAIESLNKAPNSFIQFKAIEILLHLYNINNELFSMIELDFDQYSTKLSENSSTLNSSEKAEEFKNILIFVKEKCNEDFMIINNKNGKAKGKGKSLGQNAYIKKDKMVNASNIIINIIADKMTCPISHEPSDELCILRCQHVISLNNFKKLKRKNCPQCRETIENSNIRYLPQNSTYKNLYSYLFDAGHVLPLIEFEHSNQIPNNSDSENSEADIILTKKKKYIKEIKLNSNRLLQPIFRTKKSKKQHLAYQNVIKELGEKHYVNAILRCQEYLKIFPKSYSMRCILAYIYRNINDYDQALLYLNEAIELKEKNPKAYYLCGEIYFRQNKYQQAIFNLETSIYCKIKINNIFVILGNSYFLKADEDKEYIDYYYNTALEKYGISLQNDPNNYYSLKYCAYIYEFQEKYINALKILERLSNINQGDSLILCYYGEIHNNLGRYNESIIYFTKATNIDPENIHILIKRAITYYILQEYDKALLDLKKVIQIDSLNSIAYYYEGLTYSMMENINNAMVAFRKCLELNPNNEIARMLFDYLEGLQDDNFEELKKLNICDSKLLHFMKCKVYIKLKNYDLAFWQLNRLISLDEDISFVYLLREYSEFWSYICSHYEIVDISEFTELGIINKFSGYMYYGMRVYFISNLINLDDRYNRFLINDSNSLSGQVLSFENEVLPIKLPKLFNNIVYNDSITWKINVKKILYKECFLKFIIVKENSYQVCQVEEHKLSYEDLSKLEGLGWIEYTLQFKIRKDCFWIQPSIEIKNRSIILQIDYVRFVSKAREKVTLPNIKHFLTLHKYPNVPETFKDKYFSRKEMENLIELQDIVNNSNTK
ncbi:hypothetical protein C1645_740073 [Glomus cerebriforme]|uniref:Uncharacterized protein n=1 Tax=Glomus cerebriforme TaxID=658196 RepID=A0A397SU29_9GLOM|nr:hypothetical protein C1645_740073 [Glomus cerebriforme]